MQCAGVFKVFWRLPAASKFLFFFRVQSRNLKLNVGVSAGVVTVLWPSLLPAGNKSRSLLDSQQAGVASGWHLVADSSLARSCRLCRTGCFIPHLAGNKMPWDCRVPPCLDLKESLKGIPQGSLSFQDKLKEMTKLQHLFGLLPVVIALTETLLRDVS